MYLVGNDASMKAKTASLLSQHVAAGRKLVTDVEVFQEILHRYRAIQRLGAVQDAFNVLNAVVDEVLSIEYADVEAAKSLLLANTLSSARDAQHTAVMQRRGIAEIMSFDGGFDSIPGLVRHA